LQLIQPTAGSVRFKDQELVALGRSQLRQIRSQFQIIFQDPYSSLNPRMRITENTARRYECIACRKKLITRTPITKSSAPSREKEIDALLQRVGLPLM